MSPRADCKVHWLLELACACGAAGGAFPSACSGNNPNAAGDTANAIDTPKATALRTASATPFDCLRANLKMLISFRFIRQSPPRSGIEVVVRSRAGQVTAETKFAKQFVTI